MKLRTYQEQALSGIRNSIKEGHKKILAVLPTGAGKTIIETRLTDALGLEVGLFGCIVHLCHLKDIVIKNEAYYRKHGEHQSMVMRGKDMPTHSDKVVFTTMQTMCQAKRIAKWKSRALGKKPTIFIIDESHLYGCASYDRILDAWPDAILVGFTATPFRQNFPAMNLFDNVAYAIDMESLIDQKFLTKPTMYEFSFTDEEKTDKGRIEAVFRLWKNREKDRGLPGLLACPTVDQAKIAEAVLAVGGVRTGYFDGTTPQELVTETLRAVNAGEVDILVVCRKGQLGMDIPSLGYVMLPWGVKSVISFLQVVGRVVRIHEDKKEANIYLWGTAPAVKRGLYRRMLNLALKVKEDPEGPGASLQEELDYLEFHEDPDHARIQWTKDAIASCKALSHAGLPGIAGLIERKEFPKKYANVLKRITANMVTGDVNADSGVPTVVQRRILDGYRFADSTIDGLNKGEASSLIAGMKKYMTRDPFTIPRGPYAGRHFSKTPPLYRKMIKDPVIRALFGRWVQAGRPDAPD